MFASWKSSFFRALSIDMFVMVDVGGVYLNRVVTVEEHLRKLREALWLEKEAYRRTWQEFEDFKRLVTTEAGVRPIMGLT